MYLIIHKIMANKIIIYKNLNSKNYIYKILCIYKNV